MVLSMAGPAGQAKNDKKTLSENKKLHQNMSTHLTTSEGTFLNAGTVRWSVNGTTYRHELHFNDEI